MAQPNDQLMLPARFLTIVWGDDSRYWRWVPVRETSNGLHDGAELIQVCNLDVKTTFDITNLPEGIPYEVAFVMMVKDTAKGWEYPVILGLNGEEIQIDFRQIIRDQWKDILVGEFSLPPKKKGEMKIYMRGSEGMEWKSGIIIKGVIIRKKNGE